MQPLLVGHNALQGVVAVHQLNDQTIRLYQRLDGKVLRSDAEFFPFFFLSEPHLLEGYRERYWQKELAGTQPLRYLVVFDRWSTMWDAVRHVLSRHRTATRTSIDNYAELEALYIKPDPVVQYLLYSGVTHYRSLPFSACIRMQIQIAALAPAKRAGKTARPDDRVALISLSDTTGWKRTLGSADMAEEELLEQFVALVRERDPDIIEGYNLIGFTIPYLMKRAELLGKELGIGRDESEPRRAGGFTTESLREGEAWGYDLAGRQLVDTGALAQLDDTLRRSYENLNLATLASVFTPHEEELKSDPPPLPDAKARTLSAVLRRLEAETRTVREVSKKLLQPYYALCGFCPLPLGALLRSGIAGRAELILLREYIREKHSLPRASGLASPPVLATGLLMTGVFSNVLYAEIQSMFPSIARTSARYPRGDALNAFPRLLSELLELRQLGAEPDSLRQTNAHARQAAGILLEDSLSNLMLSARALFSDPETARALAAEAERVLTELTKTIQLHNGEVIEYDTGGVYFVAPDNVKGSQQEEVLILRLSENLPSGLRLSFSSRYQKMLAYKKRNHALFTEAGQLLIRGPSLLPHTLEPFFRRFLRQAILFLMQEDFVRLHGLYAGAVRAITRREWSAHDFCRSEVAHESLETYKRGIEEGTRKPSPPYEAAVRSSLYFQPGDRIRYYVGGTGVGIKVSDYSRLAAEWDANFPDENTPYYLARLEETALKIGEFFNGEDFRKIFSVEDLFEFDPAKVTLIRKKGPPEEEGGPPPPPTGEGEEFGIWLDQGAL